MGNDGGSIPKRRELVREAARNQTSAELKETRQEQQSHQWSTCPLSHRPLVQPVVSDSAGHLYNKDAVLEYLLPSMENSFGVSKADQEEILKGQVKSLKDVVQLKFEVETETDGGDRGVDARTHNGDSRKREMWICPITRKELGAAVRSVYLVPCGHVFSESAVKEVSGDLCLQCNEHFVPENVISISPSSSAEIERLAARSRTLKEQGLSHSLKKASGSSKKRKKNGEASTAATIDDHATSNTTRLSAPAPADPNRSAGPSTFPNPATKSSTSTPPTNGIKNPATASLTARVLQDERDRKRRRGLVMNENLKDLFSSQSGRDDALDKDVSKARGDGNALDAPKRTKGGGGGGDFMTRGFSIPAGAKR